MKNNFSFQLFTVGSFNNDKKIKIFNIATIMWKDSFASLIEVSYTKENSIKSIHIHLLYCLNFRF